MGFNSVYRSLQEIFPQVDIRILKAIAIENPKDADAAVEDVLHMVLPSTSRVEASIDRQFNKQRTSSTDYQDNKEFLIGRGRRVETGQCFYLKHQGSAEETKPYSPSKPGSVASEYSNESYQTKSPYSDLKCLDEPVNASSALDDTDKLYLLAEIREKRSSAGNQKFDVSIGSDQGSQSASSSMIHEDTVISGSCNNVPRSASQDFSFVEQVAEHSYSSALSDGHQSCFDSTSEAEKAPATFLPASSVVHEAQFAVCTPKIDINSISEYKKLESNGSLESSSEQVVCDTKMVDIQDTFSSTTIVTQSGQICRIDHLEDAIEDAKSNKRTLFLAMETVLNMMKEVEFQEKEADHAKEEASAGGLDILAKVEDLRQMLHRQREVNDLHAGQVYGEKSVLATEVRELQSRLINLSDERDKSLTILDEMNQTLEARVAAAEEIRIAAEKEKQEKEESAQKALADQEAMMDQVVRESKRLQKEAEENSKLRDFLMDRGHVVDILQGEIAVICQDVKLLKEKFDECVPFSKSVSSSQTSCVLATSTSFSNDLIADRICEQDQSFTPKKISPAPSVVEANRQKNNISPEKKDTSSDGKKSLSDDDWELFENET